MYTIILIVLVVLLISSVPVYPYSRSWGYLPTGLLGTVVLVLLVLLLFGII